MRRRAALAALALLAGCVALGSDRPSPTFFVLRDTGTPTRAGEPQPRVLLLAPTTTSSFYDTQSIVFSRTPGTRAYYQFAAWTERPGKRFDALLLARFEQRGAFARTAATTAGVRGDLLLAANITELYHDDQQAPGRVRVELAAELVDRHARAVLARRTFAEEAPVGEDNAVAAVLAFDTAITRLLDALVAWVETEAAAAPRR